MAGVKGKSGARAGISNNPSGRPKGVPNKTTANIKNRLALIVNDDFMDSIEADIALIESPKDRVMARIKILDYVVPKLKAVEDEPKDTNDYLDIMRTYFTH